MTTWQIGNRRHAVTTEVDWGHGWVVYRLAGLGTFTILRDEFGSSPEALSIEYGLYEGYSYKHHNEPRPEAPKVYGITMVGGAGMREDTFTRRASNAWTGEWTPDPWWPCHRPGGAAAPDGVRKYASQVCKAILEDYLARDDYASIERARAVHLAPKRLADLTAQIEKLRAEIATRQATLTGLLAAADVQAALTAPSRDQVA